MLTDEYGSSDAQQLRISHAVGAAYALPCRIRVEPAVAFECNAAQCIQLEGYSVACQFGNTKHQRTCWHSVVTRLECANLTKRRRYENRALRKQRHDALFCICIRSDSAKLCQVCASRRVLNGDKSAWLHLHQCSYNLHRPVRTLRYRLLTVKLQVFMGGHLTGLLVFAFCTRIAAQELSKSPAKAC